MNLSKFYVVLTVAFSFVVFTTCKSNKIYSDTEEIQNVIFVDKNKNFIEGDSTYIFIRLYQPEYFNPLEPVNVLKHLISIIEVNELHVSHSSLNFSLEDNFLAVTTNGNDEWGMWFEECTNISSNGYMAKCNPELSTQTVYALKVSLEEFNNTLDFTQQAFNDKELHYSVLKNAKMAGNLIDRKFFTNEEEQNIKSMEISKKNNSSEMQEYQNRFVCSTFIAYALANNVKSIHDFFEERNLNYNNVIPSDLAELPGMVRCFSSTYENYNDAAEQFIRDYKNGKTLLN